MTEEGSKKSKEVQVRTLEGETAKEAGWRVSLVKQDNESVVVHIACASEEGDWYRLTARILKSKLKSLI